MMQVVYISQAQLSEQHINFLSIGDYWIDPNGGARDDAVLAFCHFESQSSCVKPKNLKVSILYVITSHFQTFFIPCANVLPIERILKEI